MLEPRAVRCGAARAGAAAIPWNGRNSVSECDVRRRGDTASGGARRDEEDLVVPLATGRRARTNVVERQRSSW